jgi:hypothetical protein
LTWPTCLHFVAAAVNHLEIAEAFHAKPPADLPGRGKASLDLRGSRGKKWRSTRTSTAILSFTLDYLLFQIHFLPDPAAFTSI